MLHPVSVEGSLFPILAGGRITRDRAARAFGTGSLEARALSVSWLLCHDTKIRAPGRARRGMHLLMSLHLGMGVRGQESSGPLEWKRRLVSNRRSGGSGIPPLEISPGGLRRFLAQASRSVIDSRRPCREACFQQPRCRPERRHGGRGSGRAAQVETTTHFGTKSTARGLRVLAVQ